MTHSEHFLALDVLRAAYNHGHPDDLAKCEAAFDTLDGLIEQNERLTQNIVDCNARSRTLAEKVIGLEEQLQSADEFKAAMVRANQRQVDQITSLREQLEARDAALAEATGIIEWVVATEPIAGLWRWQHDVDRVRAFLVSQGTARYQAVEASERGRNPAVDPRDAIKPESGKPRSETSASSPASSPFPADAPWDDMPDVGKQLS